MKTLEVQVLLRAIAIISVLIRTAPLIALIVTTNFRGLYFVK